ncbi:hypothetical protein M758_1G164800 [Ceratodon purpureus]|uniref:Methyltransferase type 11 domain-containing protein n=1 Tax=Ceratodon purpureus TaxID=3225 RepID=A0A8T0J927_CERPU|nr:hypothetical protein KC19_1G168800 [Ceratodon purpureus]KAG0630247.1 hypothetical protein M758_1G164800 [Ceratodon purpureus]
MTRALGMAATSVGPALRNVARGVGAVDSGVGSSSRRTICALARSGSTKHQALQHLHQLCGGFLSPTSRRRFLQGAGMLGMMSSAPLRAQAAGVSEAEEVLKNVQWPEQFPFSKEDFARYDESPDTSFYDAPRFVTHIDDPAIRALTKYYSSALPPSNTPGVAVLDMCSSWISHYPKGYKQERIVGLGLNEAELQRNEVLTEHVVQDLNNNPTLPFADNSFDVITNVVSVDYLTKPMEIFKEMHRVLKPGGLAAMSFSNRCFFTKAISIWTSTGDIDHVMIVGSYFHYSGGFEPPQALDISPNPGRSDPMYVVYSRKLTA